MEEIKISSEFFDEIIDKVSNNLIRLNCNYLLNETGLDESKFQLLLVNQLMNKEINNVKIEIEKYISPGNRCDIYLNLERDHIFIELKYIRIPFLQITRKNDNKDLHLNKKLNLYHSVNNTILKMDITEILNLKNFNKFIKPTNIENNKSIDFYEPISKIMKNALEQVKRYATEFGNDFTMKKQNIYYIVIIGIGYTIIRSELNKI
jgi:hypothetical protein